MTDHREPSPFNTLPPVVIVLALVMIVVEAAFLAAENGILGGRDGIGWRASAIEDYAFFGQVVDLMVERRQIFAAHLHRFVTYPFVHTSFTGMIFAGVFLLAMGKFVGEVFRGWAVLVVFFTSAIGGALAYGLILNDPRPLTGGFPAVYGLIGAYSYILWLVAGAQGESQLGAFRLIAMLMGIQLLFTAIFGGSNDWVADLGGFVSGFGVSFFVSPGGWARLMERTRR